MSKRILVERDFEKVKRKNGLNGAEYRYQVYSNGQTHIAMSQFSIYKQNNRTPNLCNTLMVLPCTYTPLLFFSPQIYKEELCDLLVPVSTRVKDSVAIREDIQGGIKLTGLQEKCVAGLQETLDCLERGAQGRTTGATSMNSTSSRSHAIFTLHIDRVNKADR